jgi:hypothetical protein
VQCVTADGQDGPLNAVPRILRIGLAAFSVFVLSGIIPISITHWHTGDACPVIGPIPACYVVSVCYAAMGIGSLLWTMPLKSVFFAGATPVILLALAGTSLELMGRSTCPISDAGTPLCFYSLAVGIAMLIVFLIALKMERSQASQQ